ncbi:hypothetical protein [Burkholderia sp. Ac-20353]|uniref:hypothetical protein n=1 Tax=Burkholderia sp. Ac-20353 TaxID=2703894 RepID=UPI00197C0FA8|nr:hypothetical protein [Burkholderia sp. Ac-20353]MBN3786456.1 hypothetical protein [Burkholderia sp. Ac-20353]
MTRPTGKPNISDALNARAPHSRGPVLRVALSLWGIDERDAQTWLAGLRSLHPRLDWWIARDRAAAGYDIVVHVVKPTAHRPGGFCWNCIGANGALNRSLAGTRTEIALFAGDASQLPHRRSGFWAVAGALDTGSALDALGRSMHASAGCLPDGRIMVRRDLLAMIAQRLDAI